MTAFGRHSARPHVTSTRLDDVIIGSLPIAGSANEKTSSRTAVKCAGLALNEPLRLGKRKMSIYDVIDKWKLADNTLDFRRYTRTAISTIANDVQSCYKSDLPVKSGRFHQSLATATDIVENRKPIEDLALPLLYSKQLILPDPLYSALSPKANSTWRRLPESGCKGFSDTPTIHIEWKSYWSTPIETRIEYLNATIPALVTQLIKLRPLVDAGFVLLQPWEIAVAAELDSIKRAILELKSRSDLVREITQRLKQAEYNLGVRLGPISITANADVPATGLKKGDTLWIVDKTEILVIGLIHSVLASRYHSNFVESLSGDRLVFDFVRTDGVLRPQTQNLSGVVNVPNLANALWPDIVAIKKDSELLSQLQERIAEAAYCGDEDQLDLVREGFAEVQAGLMKDASIMRRVNLSISELIVCTAVGVGSNLITGADLEKSALAAALTAGGTFAHKLVSEYFDKENRAARRRRDLIVRVNSRIS